MGFPCRPGPLGSLGFRRLPHSPGPLGYNDFADPGLEGVLVGNSPGPLGICDYGDPFLAMGPSPYPDYLTNEFKLLKGKITDRSETEYVDHIVSFFGSIAAYNTFAEESDKELDETKGLRRLIELHGDAQTVFYRWVRKAYKNNKVTDVPALIKRQQSKELSDALQKVRIKYTKGFKAGGFNPRPMKDAAYRYRLGTVSEHGMGTAMDVEDASNPILSLGDWSFIQELTETKPPIVRTLKRWKDNPEDLWQDIKTLNDSFVKKVAERVKQIENERAELNKKLEAEAKKEKPEPWYVEYVKKQQKEKAKPPEPPLDVVLKGHPSLKAWTNGFFTLDKELIKVLHDHDFIWGATFSNAVDLHHFELP